jgi:hypothetical protein
MSEYPRATEVSEEAFTQTRLHTAFKMGWYQSTPSAAHLEDGERAAFNERLNPKGLADAERFMAEVDTYISPEHLFAERASQLYRALGAIEESLSGESAAYARARLHHRLGTTCEHHATYGLQDLPLEHPLRQYYFHHALIQYVHSDDVHGMKTPMNGIRVANCCLMVGWGISAQQILDSCLGTNTRIVIPEDPVERRLYEQLMDDGTPLSDEFPLYGIRSDQGDDNRMN